MRAIDAWANVGMPPDPEPWQIAVARDLFKRPFEEIFRPYSQAEMLASMDALGVERAVLTVEAGRPDKHVIAFAEDHPERFALSVLVDPRRGLPILAELEALAGSLPVVLARAIPCVLGLPPDDRVYYPLYARCVRLGLPISLNTGIPGPPLPGRCQDPMHLDDVCLFFPELSIIMANGADPWWNVAIRLMLKYPKLYLMTSAYAPRYLPDELLAFMRKRGRDKVMFATDFPFLTLERCIPEVRALGLPDEARDAYLYGNARRVLWGD